MALEQFSVTETIEVVQSTREITHRTSTIHYGDTSYVQESPYSEVDVLNEFVVQDTVTQRPPTVRELQDLASSAKSFRDSVQFKMQRRFEAAEIATGQGGVLGLITGIVTGSAVSVQSMEYRSPATLACGFVGASLLAHIGNISGRGKVKKATEVAVKYRAFVDSKYPSTELTDVAILEVKLQL